MDKTVDTNHRLVAGGEVSWQPTTASSPSEEDEDATVTIVIVVIGVIAVIVVLFSMGIFIDCRYRKKDGAGKKRLLRLQMRTGSVIACQRNIRDDGKSLASNMCPSGNSDLVAARDTDISVADPPRSASV